MSIQNYKQINLNNNKKTKAEFNHEMINILF